MLDIESSQVIIQIIAFLLMFWIMKRYGWKALLGILEERRRKIQEEFKEIALQKSEVNKLSLHYEEKLKEIEKEMRHQVQKAVGEGQKLSREIQEEGQKKAQEILEKAKTEIKGEMTKAKIQLKDEIVTLVMKTTEKVIKEELDESRQKTLIAHFLDEAKV